MLIASDVRAYICRDPVDMRKAIDGLSYLVERLKGKSIVGHVTLEKSERSELASLVTGEL